MADHCPLYEVQTPYCGLHVPKGPGSSLQLRPHVIPLSFSLSTLPSDVKLAFLYYKLTPISRPLHLLLPLPGRFFYQIFAQLVPVWFLGVRQNIMSLQGLSLAIMLKLSLPLPPLTLLHCPIYFLWNTFLSVSLYCLVMCLNH